MRNRIRIRPRLSYANVMATIAVFGVLGGGAYATHSHRTTTEDLRNRAVERPKLANRAVVPRKLRPNAIAPRHLQPGAVRASALAGGVLEPVTEQEQTPTNDDAVKNESVTCPDDMIATGGGAGAIVSPPGDDEDVAILRSEPLHNVDGDPIGWSTQATNVAGSDVDWHLRATAVCVVR